MKKIMMALVSGFIGLSLLISCTTSDWLTVIGIIALAMAEDMQTDMGTEYKWVSDVPEDTAKIRSYTIKDGTNSTDTTIVDSKSTVASNTVYGISAKTAVQFSASLDVSEVYYTAKVFVNGLEVITKIDSSSTVTANVPLKLGQNNYITVIIYDKATEKAVGRSKIVKIKSTATVAKWQFQLVWDNDYDLDLHVRDADTGVQVYWGNKIYKQNNWDMKLDVDNTKYGPESILVYEVAAGGILTCFVNLYSSTAPASGVKATVSIFSNGNLYEKKNITLVSSNANAGVDWAPGKSIRVFLKNY